MNRKDDEGKGMGPCGNESYKVLNFTIFLITSTALNKNYNLHGAKCNLQEYNIFIIIYS